MCLLQGREREMCVCVCLFVAGIPDDGATLVSVRGREVGDEATGRDVFPGECPGALRCC
ncbi:hypothetical protein HanXRQr2_Chr16g0778191 [Helianthus annuus]|uniref:Uncharacterized protein n=1 Tax=Helianthus annuus TaxID=4232 RepID=A0A9K3DW92_HELAN|nr:hypothetical protein HanXRQr2_Chr16g0778191 [Helianthus annuus]